MAFSFGLSGLNTDFITDKMYRDKIGNITRETSANREIDTYMDNGIRIGKMMIKQEKIRWG